MHDNSILTVLMPIIKMLLASLPFILLCLGLKKVNLNKIIRNKQFAMPVLAVIYSIVIMIFSNRINGFLIDCVNRLAEWLSTWTGISFLPSNVNSILDQLSTAISDFIKNLNLTFWVFFIANAAILLVYIVFKGAMIGIMKAAIKNDNSLYKSISDNFYDYHEDKDVWCVRNKFIQARTLLKVFYYSAVVITIILMMVSKKWFLDETIKSVFYPVFSIIMVGEVVFYLDGLSWNEYLEDILGENENAFKIANYSLLRKFLNNLFADKLLAEDTLVNNTLTYSTTNEEIFETLEKDEDPKINAFASYLKHINADGFEVDHNYIFSSVELLKGHSVLFNNPFYNDLIPYAFYPMNRELLRHNKVLVMLGRHAIENDIINWLENGIGSVTNLPYLWNIEILRNECSNADIGIITRSDMLKSDIIEANSGFLRKVSYIVIIEPSRLMPTSQIGLELIIKKCRVDDNDNITFCLCDKNCDGLVDAISHALCTNLTEVTATNKYKGALSYMCWDADDEHLHHRLFSNVSRYLGVGTELSFAALKNQVSKTHWFGGEAFPVTDINWIDRQYYHVLNGYAGIPENQEAFAERFQTTPNLWSAEISDYNYFTVEDESFNMFEVLREFSNRSKEQGFINVVSSNYLLKDYMASNATVFETDSKAIPYFSAEYTRTDRNIALRLLLQFSTEAIKLETIEKELSLLGYVVFDIAKQVWFEIYKCFTSLEVLSQLPMDYTLAVNEAFEKPVIWKEKEIFSSVITVVEEYNVNTGYVEKCCNITDKQFLEQIISSLKSAEYIVEDEKGNKNYIGAELRDHIYQKLLPGQFFTYDGKYYEMLYLTHDGKVLVRRAADHIESRKTYSQIRNYNIRNTVIQNKIGSVKNYSGLRISKEMADFSVETSGYYVFNKYCDFKTAQKVIFEGEINRIPIREYFNKTILRIDFPRLSVELSDKVRYTLTVLLNEVFRTLYAENQHYIVAVTDTSFMDDPDVTEPLTYSLRGEGVDCSSIYIIEDSSLDLGLLISVERNLQRILKIIDDYIDWHNEAIELSMNPPAPPEPPKPPVFPDNDEPQEKKSFFRKIVDFIKKPFIWIKGLFGKRKEPANEEKPLPTSDISETSTESGPDQSDVSVPFEEPISQEEAEYTDDADAVSPDLDAEISTGFENEEPFDNGSEQSPEEISFYCEPDGEISEIADDSKPDESDSDSPDNPPTALFSISFFGKKKKPKNEEEIEDTPEDSEVAPVSVDAESDSNDSDDSKPGEDDDSVKAEESADASAPRYVRKPYHENHFFLFGGETIPDSIDLQGTLDLLNSMGFDRNELKKVREAVKETVPDEEYAPNKPGFKYCDFCGARIFGVEYETLSDGRDRCVTCGNSSVKEAEDFKKIFIDVKRNMEGTFGIKINTGIKVRMVNSKKLHKMLGESFVPTDNYDPRTVGVAIKDRNGYSLYIENGTPRIRAMLTIAHELTHIWQYLNWDDKQMKKIYGKDMLLEIYEGMAKWVEIQFAYIINEKVTAKREEIITLYRNDEYGRGFVMYVGKYPFSTGTSITNPTPFMFIDDPLRLKEE